MKKLLLFAMIFLCGCASVAGPFVTSISSDGKGGLIIQKGYARYNYWFSTIENQEAGETKVQILPEK